MTTDQVTIEKVRESFYVTKQGEFGTMYLTHNEYVAWTNKIQHAASFSSLERAEEIVTNLFSTTN
jgi:hypothetical protein